MFINTLIHLKINTSELRFLAKHSRLFKCHIPQIINLYNLGLTHHKRYPFTSDLPRLDLLNIYDEVLKIQVA